MATMRILVTGAAGFTGAYLLPLLAAAGHETFGIAAPAEAGATWPSVDLLDRKAIRDLLHAARPHAIIHLAAKSFVADADHAEIYATNIMGTRNLLAEAVEIPETCRLILSSSGNIYSTKVGEILKEDSPLSPANDYGISKYAMEKIPDLWHDRFDVLVTRPFNYTGRGQSVRFLVPKIVDAFRRRQDVLELGNLDIWRDFSDVRDVAQAYADLVAGATTGIVNLCSGSTVSLREVVAMCEEITGHRIGIRSNPSFVRPNEIRRLVGSNDRLRGVLPAWSPRPFRQTLQWMLDEQCPVTS